ncbi:hypothetical protein RJ639_036183 [Escallonia herrerae]|uniref:Uncharacterized protein n=1 Tax=Escallonia herrerae TaxID=1293975 RepID=A0AA88WR47_9ASTE|nr:hypothetical protein RJ639_036183 [Escallonia herrerae]
MFWTTDINLGATNRGIFKPLKTDGMHRNVRVENADRWVAGFLEMFEEGCHKMRTVIRDRIQERLRGQHEPNRRLNCTYPNGFSKKRESEVTAMI